MDSIRAAAACGRKEVPGLSLRVVLGAGGASEIQSGALHRGQWGCSRFPELAERSLPRDRQVSSANGDSGSPLISQVQPLRGALGALGGGLSGSWGRGRRHTGGGTWVGCCPIWPNVFHPSSSPRATRTSTASSDPLLPCFPALTWLPIATGGTPDSGLHAPPCPRGQPPHPLSALSSSCCSLGLLSSQARAMQFPYLQRSSLTSLCLPLLAQGLPNGKHEML